MLALILFLQIIYSTSSTTCENDEKPTLEELEKLWNANLNEALKWNRPERSDEFDGYNKTCESCGSYDFIIIGAGASGAVLANRLSENPNWKILLLEAGEDETYFSRMPGAYIPIQVSKFNWGYLTTPQKHACFGLNNNQCPFPRGKALGGDTALNENTCVRGNKHDFDVWGRENPGWSYKDVLYYFKKSEDATNIGGDPKFRGFNGPLAMSYGKPEPDLLETVIGAHNELGFETLDYNGENQIGVNRMQANTKNGQRFSTNQAYLKPVRERKNLVIKTKSLVTKIILKNKVAVGVKFINNKQCFKVRARNEVLLAAGTSNSPQLLMLSGVGPKKNLEKLGIQVIKDLPVGKNLYDHFCLFGVTFITDYKPYSPSIKEDLQNFLDGTGRLSTPIALEISFRKIYNKSYPDIEIMHTFPVDYIPPQIFAAYSNARTRNESDTGDVEEEGGVFTSHVALLHPKSEGYIKLKSADPLDFPIINPRYLSHIDDVETIYQGVLKVIELLDTEAFKGINARLADHMIPACKALSGKEFWYCYIRNKATSLYHPTGTCRMGSSERNSVVDYNLNVHGLRNIRVVDTSVVPNTTSGHMNIVSSMMAEKIADDIKKYYGFNNY